MKYSDVLVVGSGFGGAISATNIANAAKKSGLDIGVTILERGHDFHNFDPNTVWKYRNNLGNGFKQTFEPSYSARLMDAAMSSPIAQDGLSYPKFVAMSGKGVGGSSLVYYGVKLRAPSEIFELRDGQRRLWPRVYSRETLNPFYTKAEKIFKATRLSWTRDDGAEPWRLCTKRDYVFAKGCLAIGATAEPLTVAVDNDAGDGWWMTGHRGGGRQHLPHNYLQQAQSLGVKINADCDVKWIAPEEGGGYSLGYFDHRVNQEKVISCKILILSGGVLGTLKILLDSSKHFRGARELSDALGESISGNGDIAMSGIVGKDYVVESYKGKPMSSVCASFWQEYKFLMYPFEVPSLPHALGQPSEFAFPEHPDATGRQSTRPREKHLWGETYYKLLRDWGKHGMSIGVLTLDKNEGRVNREWTKLTGRLFIDWPTTHPETERRWMVALDKAKRIFRALGGEMLMDMYRFRGTVGTVHPLGGCQMADSKTHGVVNAWGEVFDNANMFVMDGSIIPSSIGVNPSLTISAMTEMQSTKLGNELAERLSM